MSVMQTIGLRARLRSALALLLVAIALIMPGTAAAHPFTDCLAQALYGSDPGCRAHWFLSEMRWHWGPNIDTSEHAFHKEAFKTAVSEWEAELPDSPWNAIKDEDGLTHPDVKDQPAGSMVLGSGRIAEPDGEDHIPEVIALWIRHDVEELDCGAGPCSWYAGTGQPGPNQLDEWGVWMEELGHAQNITHHVLPGHETHRDHTMSGSVVVASTAKREPLTHENEHACYAYALVHGDPC